ncbi:MAG: MarR family transcriptional regulator [Deltaproteobacteria bacterium]|nr:MarR family transcriptional regulator [Deltaproteobacteria bacterium]MBT6614279.1 MarR family transcriptional regulator [Deltaproteobacteria bacterium]MBT7155806.1 MarR family transcriptional regulator [Deltaproteobacteria bacterium]
MNPKDCIFFHLAKANQAGSRVWRSYMSRLNLTAVQGMVLNFLKDRDYITSKDLGERTLLDSATLTGILDRLEKQALVVRQAHPSDRRAVIICLTDAGRDLTQQTDQEAVAANQDFLQSLDRDEQAQLKTLLTKLREKSA